MDQERAKNRQRFPKREVMVSLAVTALVVLGLCWWSFNSGILTPQTVEATSTPIALTSPTASYDYCHVDAQSSVVDQAAAGTSQAPEIIFKQDLEAVKKLKITRGDLKQIAEGGRINVLVIPVGYSDSEQTEAKMTKLGLIAEAALPEKVNVFTLTKSVPLGIQDLERLASLTNDDGYRAVIEAVNKVQQVDLGMVVFNSDQYLGSSNPVAGYAVFAGENASSEYFAVHEFDGHTVGALGDGYRRFYGMEGIKDSSELFFVNSLGHPVFGNAWVKYIYDTMPVKPPVFHRGVCGESGVGGFYEDGTNVMNNIFSSERIEKLIDRGKSMFNDVQQRYIIMRMQSIIDNRGSK